MLYNILGKIQERSTGSGKKKVQHVHVHTFIEITTITYTLRTSCVHFVTNGRTRTRERTRIAVGALTASTLRLRRLAGLLQDCMDPLIGQTVAGIGHVPVRRLCCSQPVEVHDLLPPVFSYKASRLKCVVFSGKRPGVLVELQSGAVLDRRIGHAVQRKLAIRAVMRTKLLDGEYKSTLASLLDVSRR